MANAYNDVTYRFLPWVRRGLAAAHATPDPLHAPLPAHPDVSLGVRVAQRANPDDRVPINLRIFGAGDIIGIDTRLIVRTEPRAQARNFEANFLACIDFDPPDFPWAFTPAKADEHDRLRPWLVLLVLDAAKVKSPHIEPLALLPVIEIDAVAAATELPNLDHSWSWAHAQVVSTANDDATIRADLARDPRLNISRLISPRRLKPNSQYLACLVPAFKAGVLRGLGLIDEGQAGPDILEPAWEANQNGNVKLPVYFHWEFSTGPAGDFESLARRLRTPPMVAGNAEIKNALKALGTVPIAIDADQILARPPISGVMEGAMVNLSHQASAKPDPDVADSLLSIVNTAEGRAVANPVAENVADLRLDVKPPIYGAWHARRHKLVSSDLDKDWLTDLNLDPRYRAAAGYGVEVVKRDQEEFVEACLRQLGDVLATEALLNRGRLSREALRVIHNKHLAVLPPERLLYIVTPLHARLMLDKTALTVKGLVKASSFPDAATDPAMRRLTSARRPVLRNAARRAGLNGQLAGLMQGFVQTLASASQHAGTLDINAFVPDGLLGSRALDRLQLPNVVDAVVDLSPLGWAGSSLAAGQILQLRDQAAIVREEFNAGKSIRLRPADVRHGGVLTDLHQQRLAQFADAGQLATVQMAQLPKLLRSRATPGVEGLLLHRSAEGQVSVDGLRVDNRGGLLQLDQPKTRMLARVPALASGSALAKVKVGDARKLGAQAVFATLPPNSLDVAGKAPLELAAGADFTFGQRGTVTKAAAQASITLPPPYKSRTVVSRYAKAYKNIVASWTSPLQAVGAKPTPIDLPLASIKQQVLLRTQPETSVTARLHSMLSLDGDRLDSASHLRVGETLGDSLRQRFVIPRTFDRVMAYPHLDLPLYKRLADYDKQAFLPGVDDIPNDLILLLKTNASFIDSFMVGANYEMNRELLWRAYPTDQRGTPFHRFWQRFDGKEDIEDIHRWKREPLGKRSNPGRTDGKDFLVLLIRGQLLKRYPNTHVYAWKRAQNGLLKNAEGVPPDPMQDIREPIFGGVLGNDIVFFGFDIPPTTQEAGKWCFVLEEPMTEPRFGFDIEDDNANVRPRPLLQKLRSGQGGELKINPWKALSWSHVDVAVGSHVSLMQLSQLVNTPFPGATDLPADPSAADFAHALIQLPFRGFYLGNDLIP